MCGLFPAAEAHHWAWRYPADADVTRDDLTALCRRCHWWATLLRLTGRAQAGVWFILAAGRPSVQRRKRVARHQPRSCRGPATRSPEPDLYALIERCHLVLVVGCLACERYVRLDAVLSHRPCWRSMSVTQLCRRLCCCRCRSRTRWVLLGGWPPAGPGGSAEHLRRDGAERAGYGADRADPDGSSGDTRSRHAKRCHHEGAAAEVVGRDLAVTTAPRPARRGVAVPPARPERRAAVTPGPLSRRSMMRRIVLGAEDGENGDGKGAGVAGAAAGGVTLVLPESRGEYEQAASRGREPCAGSRRERGRRAGRRQPGRIGRDVCDAGRGPLGCHHRGAAADVGPAGPRRRGSRPRTYA